LAAIDPGVNPHPRIPNPIRGIRRPPGVVPEDGIFVASGLGCGLEHDTGLLTLIRQPRSRLLKPLVTASPPPRCEDNAAVRNRPLRAVYHGQRLIDRKRFNPSDQVDIVLTM
jgi:hypothetical protein